MELKSEILAQERTVPPYTKSLSCSLIHPVLNLYVATEFSLLFFPRIDSYLRKHSGAFQLSLPVDPSLPAFSLHLIVRCRALRLDTTPLKL